MRCTREIRLGAAVALAKMCERREHRLGARVVATLDACARLVVRRGRERRLELGREGRHRQRVIRGDLRVIDADEAQQQGDGDAVRSLPARQWMSTPPGAA
jgi:hypothetical protein